MTEDETQIAKSENRSRREKWSGWRGNLAVMVVSFLLCCLVAEAALRVVHARRLHTFELDDDLGWRTLPNLSARYEVVDHAGTQSSVYLETNEDGFRMYSAEESNPRILIVGDSFTFGKDVSQDQTYYARLNENWNASFFVYGGEGYNTLQEYMILDRYIDDIEPDAVILQFCWNDFIGNSMELEQNSIINNNGYRRPYPLDSGQNVYLNPKGLLHTIALKYSRLLYSIVYRVDRAAGLSRPNVAVEDEIERQGSSHSGLMSSSERTLEVLKRFRERCGTIPVFVFSIDDREPYFSLIQQLCAEADIEFIGGVGPALRAAESGGATTKAGDGGHWNALGHEVCAGVLNDALASKVLQQRTDIQ